MSNPRYNRFTRNGRALFRCSALKNGEDLRQETDFHSKALATVHIAHFVHFEVHSMKMDALGHTV